MFRPENIQMNNLVAVTSATISHRRYPSRPIGTSSSLVLSMPQTSRPWPFTLCGTGLCTAFTFGSTAHFYPPFLRYVKDIFIKFFIHLYFFLLRLLRAVT